MANKPTVSSDLVRSHLTSLADIETALRATIFVLGEQEEDPFVGICYTQAMTNVRRARRMLENARDSLEEIEQKQREGDRAAPKSPSRPAA